jgi:hypothetical protein
MVKMEKKIKVWINPQDGYLETEEIPGARVYITTLREMKRYNRLRAEQIQKEEMNSA